MTRPGPTTDRLTRSRRNPFAAVLLDRADELRNDPNWLNEALESPQTRFLPLWKGRAPIDPSRRDAEVIYVGPEARTWLAAPPTLLGRDEHRSYFAIPLDDREQRDLIDRHPGAEFFGLRSAADGLHEKHAGILAYAKAILYWQYRNGFCSACGSGNRIESAGHRLVCSNPGCGRESFPRIDPSVIVLVTHGDACLLGRNARWPERRFSALAGYVEPGESLEDAVVREVFEESRVRLSSIEYVSSQPWPFPASTMCGFYATAEDRHCEPTEEMTEVRWFTAESLARSVRDGEIRIPPPISIAFRLISDWHEQQTGEDLEPLVRASGGWISRKGIK